MENGETRGAVYLFRKARFQILLILVLGIIAYSSTLGVPFLFDDNLFIENIALEHPQAWDISGLVYMFTDTGRHFGSRPLLNATLLLNYYAGGMETWGYHAVNLCLHLINGVLLYLLISLTGRRLDIAEEDVRPVSLLASLLFVLHPVQTEAVTNVIGRSMLLSTAFFLSGLLLFAKAVASDRRRAFHIAGLFLVSLLGASSREDFFAFPAMLFLYDLFFISRFRLRAVAGHLRAYLAVVPGLIYLVFLVINSTFDRAGQFPLWEMSARQYLFTQFNVFWTYMRLLVLPAGQTIDYAYPTARALFEFPTLLSAAGYLGVWAGGVALARRRPAISFGVLWFLIALIPASFGIVLAGLLLDMRLGDAIFEHRLYLASAGPVAIAAVALVQLSKRRKIFIPAVAAVVLVLGGAAYARNAVWKDAISLWGDAARKAPESARAHSNLAIAYAGGGFTDRAIEHFTAALRLKPEGRYHYNLGTVYYGRDPGKAIAHLEASLLSSDPAVNNPPTLFRVHSMLGTLYREGGQYEKAVSHLHSALLLNPPPPDMTLTLYGLGTVYERMGKTERALDFYLAVLRTLPGDAELHRRTANVYDSLGQHEKAEEHRREAQALEPGSE